MRKLVPGYRYFRCDECGKEWREECRDHASPSGSDCGCGGFVHPWNSEPADLPVDTFGNLIER